MSVSEDIERVAEETARLVKENSKLRRDLGDAQNRHDALREEFDLFRESMLEQLGIRSMKALLERRRRVVV